MEGPFKFVELDDTTGEAGMATAEYAMGTLTATGIAGILWWIIKLVPSRFRQNLQRNLQFLTVEGLGVGAIGRRLRGSAKTKRARHATESEYGDERKICGTVERAGTERRSAAAVRSGGRLRRPAGEPPEQWSLRCAGQSI